MPTAAPARVDMSASVSLEVLNTGTVDRESGRITGISVRVATESMSDSRANGTMNVSETVQPDPTGAIGYLWTTATLENAGGSWIGTCRGFAWDGGNTSAMSCWLAGRDGYAGLTYAYTATNSGFSLTEWSGLIYRGAAPPP
jgi:hypothetical protein